MKTATRPLRVRSAEGLLPHNACLESRTWLQSLPRETTARQAWQQCQRGDWMLWLRGRIEELRTTRRAAANAVYAADAAAANAVYADAARLQTLSKSAEIVRKHYPYPPRLRRYK